MDKMESVRKHSHTIACQVLMINSGILLEILPIYLGGILSLNNVMGTSGIYAIYWYKMKLSYLYNVISFQ